MLLADETEHKLPSAIGSFVYIDVATMENQGCGLSGQIWLPCGITSATIEISDGGSFSHSLVLVPKPSSPVVSCGDLTLYGFSANCIIDLTVHSLRELRWQLAGPDGIIKDLGYPQISRIDIPGMNNNGRAASHIKNALSEMGRIQPHDADIARRFESLGDNCEFGVALAMHGINRPSLFRFGGTSEFSEPTRLPPNLLTEAIENYFDGLAEGDDLTFFMHGPEWISTSTRYRFMNHTGITNPDLTREALRKQQNRRIRLAVRTFIELAHSPETVFVRKSNGHETEVEVRAHLDALRGMGNACLLWVSKEADEETQDSVSLLGNGLIKTSIRRFAHYADAGNPDIEGWWKVVLDTWLVIEGVMKKQKM